MKYCTSIYNLQNLKNDVASGSCRMNIKHTDNPNCHLPIPKDLKMKLKLVVLE